MGGQMEGGAPDKCSAFIALKPYTSDGKIVCAHNSFDNLLQDKSLILYYLLNQKKEQLWYFNLLQVIFVVLQILL